MITIRNWRIEQEIKNYKKEIILGLFDETILTSS